MASLSSSATSPTVQSIPIWTRLLRNFCNPKKPSRAQCCTYLSPDHPIEQPDLAIYSQNEQLALGTAPSWDSPDITTNDWRPFRLKASSKVTVRNLSPKVSAVNALVHFFTSPFGIGMPRTLLASKMITLPPASQVVLDFPLDAATLAGDQRIGVYVGLEHPHDEKAINNSGEQVHVGAYTTESGRTFDVSIPVLNNTNFTRSMLFNVLPTDLVASVTPNAHTFAPHAQINIKLHVQVPTPLVGTPGNEINRAVTVIAKLNTGALVGGVTRLLRIDN